MNHEDSSKAITPSSPNKSPLFPGGSKTFFGKFQRVKVEGRRGRGYWEWKSAEHKKEKCGHEGDDEMTSLESDTLIRRCPPVGRSREDAVCHPKTCGIKVLPPFLPAENLRNDSNKNEKDNKDYLGNKVVDFLPEKPLKSILVKGNTKKEHQYFPSPHPSAPPKSLVCADAKYMDDERTNFILGHRNKLVDRSSHTKYLSERDTNSRRDHKSEFEPDKLKITEKFNKSDTNVQNSTDLSGIKDEHDQRFESGKVSDHFVSKKATFNQEDNYLKCRDNNPIYPIITKKHLCSTDKYSPYKPDETILLNESSIKTTCDESFKEPPRTKAPTPIKNPVISISRVQASYQSGSAYANSQPLHLINAQSATVPKKQNRKSGALVWVNQPGRGAKLEWIPTAGLSTIRIVSNNKSQGAKISQSNTSQLKESNNGVAGSKEPASKPVTKTSITPDEQGDNGEGVEKGKDDGSEKEARAKESNVTRAVSSAASADCYGSAGNCEGRECLSERQRVAKDRTGDFSSEIVTLGNAHSPKYSLQKNVYSSVPGEARPAGRTNPLTGILTGGNFQKSQDRDSTSSGEDKIVSVAGRNQGQLVRIRVRPEVHAYLSNLPVINSLFNYRQQENTRRDSFHSGNSSVSALTCGSGEASVGYQEEDYLAVVDEYTLLNKAVDEQDPEAIRLLTETESVLSSEAGDGSSEYPYLKEMKERLLIAGEPRGMSRYEDHEQDHQLLEVHEIPVGTVVKLNADGYGSHTSPTRRVESLYTDTLQSRRTHHEEFYPKNAKTSSFITISMLYATLLVVICLGFVLSEVLTHNVPLYYYEAFFTYLYGLSLLFLLYVFCYLLSDSTRDRTPKSKKSKNSEGNPGETSPTQEKLTSPTPKPKKTKTSDNDQSHGSFFLRIGAIAFGLGTMIYNGLEFGIFLEIPQTSPCFQILRGVNPLLQLVFTFMQMYFIFMNARLNIHKFKFIARFGLMHIVATNLCVWIRTLVRESLKEINEYRVTKGHTGEDYMIMEGIRRALENKGLMAPNRYMYNLEPFDTDPETNQTIPYAGNWVTEEDLINRTCERMEIMGSIVSNSAPYLYPFLVEYSLIAAAVVYIMWKHIGRNPKFLYDPEIADGTSVETRRCHSKVDCVGASKGLFCGLLVLVATLICLILFFVLIHREELRLLAIYLADVSHIGIMFFSILAIFIGFIRIRHLKFYGEREEELDDILLLISAFGLFTYAVFSAVAGSLSAFVEEPNLLVMSTGIVSIVQVIIQMVFIKDAQRRQVSLPEHERTRPGRQVVTFLLICNLAMWIIYTFETEKVEANPVQLEFFGKLSWTILLRCTLPLAIFHRFHSSVVLASIWKNSYKTRIE